MKVVWETWISPSCSLISHKIIEMTLCSKLPHTSVFTKLEIGFVYCSWHTNYWVPDFRLVLLELHILRFSCVVLVSREASFAGVKQDPFSKTGRVPRITLFYLTFSIRPTLTILAHCVPLPAPGPPSTNTTRGLTVEDDITLTNNRIIDDVIPKVNLWPYLSEFCRCNLSQHYWLVQKSGPPY